MIFNKNVCVYSCDYQCKPNWINDCELIGTDIPGKYKENAVKFLGKKDTVRWQRPLTRKGNTVR